MPDPRRWVLTTFPERGISITKHLAPVIITFSIYSDIVGIRNERVLGMHLECVKKLLGDNHFEYVEEKLLEQPYTGVAGGYSTWWHRFLDYQ